MAVGTYVEEAGPQEERGRRADTRVMVVGVVLALTMVAAVAFVGVSPADAMPVEMLAQHVSGKDLQLAVGIIQAAPHASVPELEQMLRRWKSDDIAAVGQDGTQMLASNEGLTTALADSGMLCAKKDVIFAKLDQLLAKLRATGVTLNTTDAASYQAKTDALGAWLDSESAYRLMTEKEKEAKEGASFARAHYEKSSEAAKKAQERVDQLIKEYGKEQDDIDAERELIKEIMRLLGILKEQPLTDKGKDAGGYTTTVGAKGSPEALKEVKDKLAELRERVKSSGGAGNLQQLDHMSSKLASYAETDEIKKILLDLLKDCDQREEVMKRVLEEAKGELKQHKDDLVQYETELVDLSNAADKAEQEADAEDLKRQKLNGKKVTTGESYMDEHAAYLLTSPPNEREIFIILVIKKKISDFCAPAAA